MKKENKIHLMKSRVMWLFVFAMLLFIGIAARLTYISIVDSTNHEQYILKQQINRLTESINQIEPKRGSVFDRRGVTLARSDKIYRVIFDPDVIHKNEKDNKEKVEYTLTFLSGELEEITEEELRDIYAKKATSKYERIVSGLSYDEVSVISEAIENRTIVGVSLEENYTRVYPQDSLASNVIGFYRLGGTGQYGIEGYYEDYLSGSIGRRFGIIDESQGIQQNDVEAEDGYNITLNLDFTVQQYIEEAITHFYEEEEAEAIRIIVMDPRDGQILGMAAYPDYDLNKPYDLSKYFSEEEITSLTGEEKKDFRLELWKNQVISNGYEPGSTFKPFTVAMALEEHRINLENDTFFCSGSKIPFPGEKPISCWKKSGHGEQTIFEALSNSCNVALMDIGLLVGRDFFYHYQQMFGFGAVTGIDLPGDVSMRNNLYKLDELDDVQLQTSSFGQGQELTPIQLIAAFAALINGGNLYEPQLMREIVASDGRLIMDNEPVILRKVISEEVSELTKEMLEVVVDEGTGKSAQIEGYSVGGKTGTAEEGDRDIKEYIVSFIGFSPTDNPEVIALVVVDKPKSEDASSIYAARIFKDMMTNILPYLRVPRVAEEIEGK